MRWERVCASLAERPEIYVGSVLGESTGYEDAEASSKLRIQTVPDVEWCPKEGLVGRTVVEKGFCNLSISTW